jgi:2-amino-4-hydroxy-6-hydroxymethyldihydropteridine diphosphokinase
MLESAQNKIEVYIGVGSNLDQPVQQVLDAKQALQQLPETDLIKFSTLYVSSPMGPQDQPNYVNAVAMLQTTLSAHQLLEHLQAIETQQGRVRKHHWGARTLDLDILLYGDQQINTADLVIPHAGITQRAFVLYPLQEIASKLDIPGHGKLAGLLNACSANGIRKLPETHALSINYP